MRRWKTPQGELSEERGTFTLGEKVWKGSVTSIEDELWTEGYDVLGESFYKFTHSDRPHSTSFGFEEILPGLHPPVDIPPRLTKSSQLPEGTIQKAYLGCYLERTDSSPMICISSDDGEIWRESALHFTPLRPVEIEALLRERYPDCSLTSNLAGMPMATRSWRTADGRVLARIKHYGTTWFEMEGGESYKDLHFVVDGFLDRVEVKGQEVLRRNILSGLRPYTGIAEEERRLTTPDQLRDLKGKPKFRLEIDDGQGFMTPRLRLWQNEDVSWSESLAFLKGDRVNEIEQIVRKRFPEAVFRSSVVLTES